MFNTVRWTLFAFALLGLAGITLQFVWTVIALLTLAFGGANF